MKDVLDLPFDEPLPAPDTAEPTQADAQPERHVWSVTEITASVRGLLERQFAEVWIEGEVSNCRIWNTGHAYFTLKDSGAQLKAVMFRSAVRYLKFKPEDGLHVVVRGRISVYDPKGEYQVVCEHMEPHGLGALQLAFDQLKKRLQAEGLFNPARKRPLPALPRKIGVVTSVDGAALRDIINVLRRRYPNVHLVIRPTRVQGEGAAADVARGLAAIAQVPGVDVIVVGRGGGSVEDLWAFNEEIVARAIAASPLPVISAVGHEVDVTIADFVADLRAPTPSAAAELVVARKDEFRARIDQLAERARVLTKGRIERLRSRVHSLSSRPALAGWPARLAFRGRHTAELTHDLRLAAAAIQARLERRYQGLRLRLETHDLRRRFERARTRLIGARAALHAAMVRRHNQVGTRFQTVAGRLESLSPLAVLARGYAVCWNGDRTAIVRRADAVTIGEHVRVTLNVGELRCTVDETQGAGASGAGPKETT